MSTAFYFWFLTRNCKEYNIHATLCKKKAAWLFSVMVFDVQMRKKKKKTLICMSLDTLTFDTQIKSSKDLRKKKLALGVYYLESK